MTQPHRIVVIAGPTAGGKSELAVQVAGACGGEIISADSMQVYRQLNAGTAKPTPAQREAAPHHLIDCVDTTESWTVADWLERAERLIVEIQRRGRWPIVAGGTNLYLKALLEGMFEGPPADDAFRAAQAGTPAAALHRRLHRVDPEAAARIDANDHKRLVRALEVHHLTGRPISQLQRQWSEARDKSYRHNPIMIGLQWPTPMINRRINARVKAMFDRAVGEDLVTETRRLLEAGVLGEQARQAIGTKQVLDHLGGRYTLDEAIERVKIDTRRFAKAQRTWLKRYRGVRWLDASAMTTEALIEAAIDHVQQARRD